jgi:hypothetical protein
MRIFAVETSRSTVNHYSTARYRSPISAKINVFAITSTGTALNFFWPIVCIHVGHCDSLGVCLSVCLATLCTLLKRCVFRQNCLQGSIEKRSSWTRWNGSDCQRMHRLAVLGGTPSFAWRIGFNAYLLGNGTSYKSFASDMITHKRDSAKHSITDDFAFLWEQRFSDPQKSETPWPTNMKFSTKDYNISLKWLAKFHQNPSPRGRSAHVWNIRVPWLRMLTCFHILALAHRSHRLTDFYAQWLVRCGSV